MDTFEMLLKDLEAQDVKMAQVIRLLAEGFQKNEILQMVDIGKGKSQGYAYISRVQERAREIYDRKYR